VLGFVVAAATTFVDEMTSHFLEDWRMMNWDVGGEKKTGGEKIGECVHSFAAHWHHTVMDLNLDAADERQMRQRTN